MRVTYKQLATARFLPFSGGVKRAKIGIRVASVKRGASLAPGEGRRQTPTLSRPANPVAKKRRSGSQCPSDPSRPGGSC